LIKKYCNNKPKFSFTFHAYDIYFGNKWFKYLVSECYKAFSISNYNIEYVKKNYINSNKIILSRLGVFREFASIKSYHKTEFKTFTLGLLSWFVEKKGIGFLLEALLELKNKGYSDIRLILAGDGPLITKYLTFIKENQLSDSIKYIGKIKGQEKRDFFQSIDAFILPSITLKNDQDGIPVVLMEAISYGLPIISTNISGIPEICIDNYNGFLIPQKDVNAIVNAIIKLIKSRELIERFSKNSLKLSFEYDININSKKKLLELGWI